MRARIALLAVLGMLVAAAPAAARDTSSYRGLATWVDVYDAASWANPEGTVERMRARGIVTIFLETSSYRRLDDVFRPDRVARFLDAAHERGLRVVAWYLPSFANLRRDLRRSLAAVFFEAPSGARFDSFALDIESSLVRSPARRTARLLRLASGIRVAAGDGYPLGAIIPSPRAMELLPAYWPGFPYAELASLFDVFLPMAYFSYRTRDEAAAGAYVARSLEILREEAGNTPVHAIGGVASRSGLGQVRGFVEAACAGGVIGLSLYDFETTRPRQWDELARPGSCTV